VSNVGITDLGGFKDYTDNFFASNSSQGLEKRRCRRHLS